MNRRLGTLAAVLVGAGLLARQSPTVLPAGLAARLSVVGRGGSLAVAAGLVVLALLGAAVALRGQETVRGFRSPAAPEDDVPELGAELSAALERAAAAGPGTDPTDRELIHESIERAGTVVIARADGVDWETARRRYWQGQWARDPTVRAFCTGESPPLALRVREALAPEPPLVRRARLTIAELAAVEARIEEGRRSGSTPTPREESR